MVNLIDVVPFLQKKKLEILAALATMPAFYRSLIRYRNLLVLGLYAFLPMFVSSFKYPQNSNMTIGGFSTNSYFLHRWFPINSV